MIPVITDLNGRLKIKVDDTYIGIYNVIDVLNKALVIHRYNEARINYLWNYRLGNQPILNREKEVRPEINNKVIENRADEIVSFKSGYLMGEPISYVSKSKENNESIINDIGLLNDLVDYEEKASLDMEIADWAHTVGTAYRMILPDDDNLDESPFEITVLDPRNTFVVYTNEIGEKPVMGVTYVIDDNAKTHYNCYTNDYMYEIVDGNIIRAEPHILGGIPIIEYPLNISRTGSFELVIPLLDAINTTESNRIDGVEQFIQALLLFHNVDISEDDFVALRELGAIKFRDIDSQLKGEIEYLVSSLNQGETQTLVDHMYQAVLEIVGMPNRNGGYSTSDTGAAVELRDGWSNAETRAKNTELQFKKSEKRFLKILLNICRITTPIKLNVRNIEIKFTRRDHENFFQKVQVLVTMLGSDKIHPLLAFQRCGLFSDPDAAYEMSAKYMEEQEKKAQELMEKQQAMVARNGDNVNEVYNGKPKQRNPGKDSKRAE